MNHLEERLERVEKKQADVNAVKKLLEKTSVSPDELNGLLESKNSSPLKQRVRLESILGRPNISLEDLRSVLPETDKELSLIDQEAAKIAEINMKYAGYITKEQEMVDKMNRLESVKLRPDLNYHKLVSLSSEAREKLTQIQPMTIGQASRISGVSPSDVSVLLVHMGR